MNRKGSKRDSGIFFSEGVFSSSEGRVPTVDLDGIDVDIAILGLVPKEFCAKHAVLPLSRMPRTKARGASQEAARTRRSENDCLVVAMADPTNAKVIDNLRQTTGLHVEPVVAISSAIRRAIEKYYPRH